MKEKYSKTISEEINVIKMKKKIINVCKSINHTYGERKTTRVHTPLDQNTNLSSTTI